MTQRPAHDAPDRVERSDAEPDAPIDAEADAASQAADDDGWPVEDAELVKTAGAELLEAEDSRTREELLAELADATTQRDEYLDDLRRARAEFENYRRRMMRDGAAQRDHGKADVAAALLDVLDDLDRTLEAVSDASDDHLAKGIELVASKLKATLEAQGLERIDAVGVPFDPSLHEAVQHREADDADEPTVAEVLRPGYRFGERVLRAAMVVVEG
ncbi:MAG: nucleotide exchange factor GrpE [Nitriliruptoraceae bacterium]